MVDFIALKYEGFLNQVSFRIAFDALWRLNFGVLYHDGCNRLRLIILILRERLWLFVAFVDRNGLRLNRRWPYTIIQLLRFISRSIPISFISFLPCKRKLRRNILFHIINVTILAIILRYWDILRNFNRGYKGWVNSYRLVFLINKHFIIAHAPNVTLVWSLVLA